jgi:oligoribonuclease NrnB/cAMP/cGMP phosphodiesterase (DHH superfamily)
MNKFYSLIICYNFNGGYMKVLLFTHIADIDGLNCVLLGEQAFDEIDYVLCDTFDINDKIQSYKSDFNNYDYIYVTDLCPNEGILDIINNSEYRSKFKVFDHHKDALKENVYDFVTLMTSNEKGMCSGTSLFYEYLTDNKYLKSNVTLDKFVELTRRYDTWEWKKYNDLEACYLMYLFNATGVDGYLSRIRKRIKQKFFNLSKEDMRLVKIWKNNFNAKIKNIIDKIQYLNVMGYKAGIVTATHDYRNDIIEYVRENGYDIDFVAVVLSDRDAISYRNVKDIDVSKIARNYGGNGHRAAASSPITKEEKQDIIKYFNK